MIDFDRATVPIVGYHEEKLLTKVQSYKLASNPRANLTGITMFGEKPLLLLLLGAMKVK